MRGAEITQAAMFGYRTLEKRSRRHTRCVWSWTQSWRLLILSWMPVSQHRARLNLARAPSARQPDPDAVLHPLRTAVDQPNRQRAVLLVRWPGHGRNRVEALHTENQADPSALFCYSRRDQTRITEYIEIYYNRIRKQARLGYLSPAAFMQQHFGKQRPA